MFVGGRRQFFTFGLFFRTDPKHSIADRQLPRFGNFSWDDSICIYLQFCGLILLQDLASASKACRGSSHSKTSLWMCWNPILASPVQDLAPRALFRRDFLGQPFLHGWTHKWTTSSLLSKLPTAAGASLGTTRAWNDVSQPGETRTYRPDVGCRDAGLKWYIQDDFWVMVFDMLIFSYVQSVPGMIEPSG